MSRKEYFNKAAERWDDHYCTSELKEFLKSFVTKFGIQKDQTVLDLGTGTGFLIPFLLQAVGPRGSITAVDYSKKMVEKCRSKFSHLPNVKFEVQDVEQLDLPSNTYDAVTCLGLFPHIENKKRALKQINRVLKPGCRLVIAHAISRKDLKKHHEKVFKVSKDVLPEKSDMTQLLRDAGFDDISIEDEPGRYLCTSTKTIRSSLG